MVKKILRPRHSIRGGISASEIEAAYKKTFKVGFWNKWLFGYGDIKLADQTYRETILADIKDMLLQDKTDQELYVTEDFDCDDFAFALMGVFHKDRITAAMPIFITWVLTEMGGHALLSFYYKGEVIMIEPQTDELFFPPLNWKLILVCG